MLSAKYSSNPYDTIRPKSFFSDLKKLYLEDITTCNGGLSFNSSWRKSKTLRKKAKLEQNDAAIFMLITPLVIFFIVFLIGIFSLL